ncbi:MAG: aminotransferase class I/II-fold pyridoxal phosphate-dependent enzyme, partial [Actinobacteria bacterium]|nr:aminotransferase class I/II-fold pyridoxal phosphate-dependent enzyme [Actinomycetota bacterium]
MDILAEANERRAAGADVLSLCVGEPMGGAPEPVLAAAAAALADSPLGYTEALGLPELRAAVAGHYRRWYDVDVDPERVVITTGSSGAFLFAFLAAFGLGDRVALARPGYPAYANILAALGCEVVDLPCGPDTRYQPTPAMLEALDEPVAGLVVASPANPTGTMIAPEELTALATWCAAHDVRLVSDEIYHGITYPGATPVSTAARFPDAVVVSSWSKFWAMTGWRLGWLVLPIELVAPVGALAGNLALCPPALSQYAALASFTPAAYAESQARVEQYAASRQVLLDAAPGLGWDRVAPADGAFYLYADVSGSGLDSVTWCRRLLAEADVAVTPGTDFDPADGERWVRVSFCVPPQVARQA